MTDLITAVERVDYSVIKTLPPSLEITAQGIVGNPGWEFPSLQFKGLTDGVLEYDFVAERKTGIWPQIPREVEVSAEFNGELGVVKAIRVNSRAHTVERRIGEDAPPADPATSGEGNGQGNDLFPFRKFLPLGEEVDGDRDPVAFVVQPDAGDSDSAAPGDLERLPLAELHRVLAFKVGADLLIYVEGFTSGFGGKLIVEQRPERILPPLFHVHALAGNDGINPDASPRRRPTRAVSTFDGAGIGKSILVQGAGERVEIDILPTTDGGGR